MTKNNENKETCSIDVIVGRFQVVDLTEGHKELINHVIELGKGLSNKRKILCVLGSPPKEIKSSKRNPIPFLLRKQMLASYLDTFGVEYSIRELKDQYTNELWSKKLDEIIDDELDSVLINDVFLHGSRDSFIDSYEGAFKGHTTLFKQSSWCSGTDARKLTVNHDLNDTTEHRGFRHGCVYTTQNRYSNIHNTVDVIVYDDIYFSHPEINIPKNIPTDGIAILLGYKKKTDKYCIIGGFVDNEDNSFEEAAARELFEETNLRVIKKELKYLASIKIDDWRYRNEDEHIITTCFTKKTDLRVASFIPSDDIDRLEICYATLTKNSPLFGFIRNEPDEVTLLKFKDMKVSDKEITNIGPGHLKLIRQLLIERDNEHNVIN